MYKRSIAQKTSCACIHTLSWAPFAISPVPAFTHSHTCTHSPCTLLVHYAQCHPMHLTGTMDWSPCHPAGQGAPPTCHVGPVDPPTLSLAYVQAWESNRRYPLSPEGGHVGLGHPSYTRDRVGGSTRTHVTGGRCPLACGMAGGPILLGVCTAPYMTDAAGAGAHNTHHT